ncbi:unnamed protein product [Cladocopium goreaui]|uniref:ATP-dependent zinc metalloprotease FtsH 3 n=1 Tax=Cladocopium goreaui TaxID=2562237 RepID=A0A9P1CSU4_9DINO|nr:unnamed protein product [Cladocopium goreaui]
MLGSLRAVRSSLPRARLFSGGTITETAGASGRLVGFGKHSALSYEDLVKVEPSYCSWVKTKYAKDLEAGETMNPNFRALGEHLQGVKLPASADKGRPRYGGSWSKGAPASSKSPVGTGENLRPQGAQGASANEQGQLVDGKWLVAFGKHKGLSFAEVLSKDPSYCEYMVNQVLTSDDKVNSSCAAFAAYVLYSTLKEAEKKHA